MIRLLSLVVVAFGVFLISACEKEPVLSVHAAKMKKSKEEVREDESLSFVDLELRSSDLGVDEKANIYRYEEEVSESFRGYISYERIYDANGGYYTAEHYKVDYFQEAGRSDGAESLSLYAYIANVFEYENSLPYQITRTAIQEKRYDSYGFSTYEQVTLFYFYIRIGNDKYVVDDSDPDIVITKIDKEQGFVEFEIKELDLVTDLNMYKTSSMKVSGTVRMEIDKTNYF